MISKRLYKDSSFRDQGTLVHLRNVIHRTNVSSVPKDNFNACDDYFSTAFHAHVLAATMEVLGMNCIGGTPTKYELPANVATLPMEEKRQIIYTIARDVLSRYISLGLPGCSGNHCMPRYTLILHNDIIFHIPEIL